MSAYDRLRLIFTPEQARALADADYDVIAVMTLDELLAGRRP